MAKKKTHVSDFARNQLEKCGWTEGAGLGQSEQGITEAIKVNLKHDSHGVGHDSAKEFTHHWWNHVYDKAAAKVQVKHSETGEVDVSQIEDDSENKESRSDKATSALYKNFVKSKTFLEDGKEMRNKRKTADTDSSSSDDEVDKEKKTRTDDNDLFRICGGRTAHKGARHGLKLSGKLARIAAQEARLSSGENSPLPAERSEAQITTAQSKVDNNDLKDDIVDTKEAKKRKKKKSGKSKGKDKSEISPEVSELDSSQINGDLIDECSTNGSKQKKKKKKSDKKRDEIDSEDCFNGVGHSEEIDKKRTLDDNVSSPRKKQKKTVDDLNSDTKCEKPKKKRKE